ncbi:MAG: hypothetical protein AAGA60_15800 [Cyanobacteria bacterium P01_E01_bin.42]
MDEFNLKKAVDEAIRQAVAQTSLNRASIAIPVAKAQRAQADGCNEEAVKHYQDAFLHLLRSEIPPDYLNQMTYRFLEIDPNMGVGLDLKVFAVCFQYSHREVVAQWEDVYLGLPWKIALGSSPEWRRRARRRCRKGELLLNLLQVFGEVSLMRKETLQAEISSLVVS